MLKYMVSFVKKQAPIVSNPEKAFMEDNMRDTLRRAAEGPGKITTAVRDFTALFQFYIPVFFSLFRNLKCSNFTSPTCFMCERSFLVVLVRRCKILSNWMVCSMRVLMASILVVQLHLMKPLKREMMAVTTPTPTPPIHQQVEM
jgi:hypothetical protein